MSRRVVVTGIGAVSPVGNDVQTMWKNMLDGVCGIEEITAFDTSDLKVHIAGTVKGFEPEKYFEKREAKKLDIYCQYALAAAQQAVDDSGILGKIDENRFGVYIGAGIGGLNTFVNNTLGLDHGGPRKVSPFFIPMMIGNMAAGQTSIALDVHGPSCDIVTACATGTDCIGAAFRVLQYGEADVMIAGGTEAGISAAPVAGFSSMKALCTDHNDDPAHASRPFDKNGSGFVMGEGAGIVILETLEHAKKRGAHIYAEVAGYGRNSDAYHVTSPAPHGVYQAKCMSLAIADAGLSPDDIDYVNAHGTSTHMNDLGETEACKTVFGARAKDVPISSVKSMTGHMLGAAGGIECIATALTVENDMLPPTINYETVDVEEGLDLDYVPNVSRKHTVRAAISNNFGFGGHNACVVLKKFAE